MNDLDETLVNEQVKIHFNRKIVIGKAGAGRIRKGGEAGRTAMAENRDTTKEHSSTNIIGMLQFLNFGRNFLFFLFLNFLKFP